MYRNIENYSKKKSYFSLLYPLLFHSTQQDAPEVIKPKAKAVSWKRYDNKIIRHINIRVMDPFGTSLDDTTQTSKNRLEHFGNSLHRTTRSKIIHNLLLFSENQPFDSLAVEESGRIVRSKRIIRQVQIKPRTIPHCKDSIDVEVRVQDSWSIVPAGSLSGTQVYSELTERNFMGWNHEVEVSNTTRFIDYAQGKSFKYTLGNLGHSMSTTSFQYVSDVNKNNLYQLSWDKPFISPLTRWAGGLTLNYQDYFRTLLSPEKLGQVFQFKTIYQDYWAGYSVKLNRSNRFSKLIFSARLYRLDFQQTADQVWDPTHYYSNETNTLVTIGINRRTFYAEKNLFNFTIREDIPLGWLFGITSGPQFKGSQKRQYFGLRLHSGVHNQSGYHNLQGQWGGFLDGGQWYQSTVKVDYLYFSNLLPLHNWHYRIFLKSLATIGDRRDLTLQDRINLNGLSALPDFSSGTLLGTKKWVISVQAQTYLPGQWNGFRFNPFFNITAGILADSDSSFFTNKVFTKLGLGVSIYNDYLVFNRFQFSFAYYPILPDVGDHILRLNTYRSFDFTLQDLQLSKPQQVEFQ